MKQVIQNLGNGEMSIVELPIPNLKLGEVLIDTSLSLISKGTEKMLVDFGKANLIEKAKLQPDKLKEVLEKFKAEGLPNTYEAIKSKLDEPITLGYSNVGTIIKVGEKVESLKVGDRVVSNGPHSEVVSVPQNLCAKIPDNVNSETASFTVIGSIALQGIRLVNPTFGETVVVIGLGLVGLMTIQLLRANGCIVIGLDTDLNKVKIAKKLGFKSNLIVDNIDPTAWCLKQNNGSEVDASIITASTTSNGPIDLATKICRKKGRIVLVGITGLNLKRDSFYKKELSFQVSCSYGSGRYDIDYENNTNNYPLGLVRWTAKRNFEAVLSAFSNGLISTEFLISKKIPFQEIDKAFTFLMENKNALGILLKYKDTKKLNKKVLIKNNHKRNFSKSDLNVSFIGAGNYAKRKLIPSFKKYGSSFLDIVSNNGLNSFLVGNKYNFEYASTELDLLFKNKKSNIVVIASRHDSHAEYIIKGLKSGKHIFVEKPLCLSINQLQEIKKEYTGKKLLMIGYNRRFAPSIQKLKNFLDKSKVPKAFNYTCNAGFISKEHWVNDKSVGGGRLIGEACHFVDLLRFLTDSQINNIQVNYLNDDNDIGDTFTIQMDFIDGSIGTINYFSNGSKSYQKETLEVFVNGGIVRIDDFKKISSWGIKNFKDKSSIFQDKGQDECVNAFLHAVQKGLNSPIPINEIFEVQEKILSLI